MESFTIGPDTFLAVANHYNDSTHNIDSKVYKKKIPNVDAGEDQMVYDSVTLDGSAFFDEDVGEIISWELDIIHQTNCNVNRIASRDMVTSKSNINSVYSECSVVYKSYHREHRGHRGFIILYLYLTY